jgi:acetyltransferase-like isoleucine patch superfamily enzyme
MPIPNLKNASIKNVTCGENVTIVEPANIYECTIGHNSFIGPFTEVQKGVIIGNNCKIQSHSFICEGVIIGDNCFIGHGAMFINDTFKDGKPAGGDMNKWQRTIVGNDVCIGSNATILPVNICNGAVIGAGAVVTKDITDAGIYVGNPAVLLKLL